MPQVPGWELNPPHLRRRWRFKGFADAVAFVNRVTELAEREGHHPDVHLTGYRDLELVLYTHSVGGLTENDFVLAARISEL